MIAPVSCNAGERVTLEGYADDFDAHIVGVEFSLDQGLSWALFDTAGSQAGTAVAWEYSFTPEVAGEYRLLVRSVADDGRRSPAPAVVHVHVAGAESIV